MILLVCCGGNLMANINDYIKWRGDLKFSSKFKFNELDSLILARFSYLIFHKIEMREIETIESIANKMTKFDNDKFIFNGDKEMITLLGQSERFKNLKVTNYVRNNSKKLEQQFGAIVIHLSKKEMYVSFIGTDQTIYGWKEDFNMAFLDEVPCQRLGTDYLKLIAKKYWNKKIRIGGHSKGGNIAIYSALTVPKKIQNRIIKVYNYDGPGLNESIYKKYANPKLISKMETYLPQDSIVGNLFNHEEKITTISSNQTFLLEHDIFSWEVNKDNLVFSNVKINRSEKLDKAIREYFNNTTKEERKIVVDSIYEIIDASKIENVSDLLKKYPILLPKILFKYKSLSKEDRAKLLSLVNAIVTTYLTKNKKVK